ncbi:RelA/SpoT domain-containing protein [Cohnella mopanensis]|uniref:RelA/SpoT domain-containing protein n=1 Tax=Cohnella mopanensis TaxID=2911966 RepID=UPI001EF78230|nr:hypothetical protein [Cohnella mopanensis]
MFKLMDKETFLKKYNISDEIFAKADIDWLSLEGIYNEYSKSRNELEPTARTLAEFFSSIEKAHSVKYRIKEPEHLIEKIIRKRSKGQDINILNYSQEITDLIGIRVLHLFKEDWEYIDKFIVSQWILHETPRANIREGDSKAKYEKHNCDIIIHPAGYRSVHYLIKSNLMIKQIISEIQVRTIFEEAWSEIDHKVRYPYNTSNRILSEYLEIFNRLSGSADEMGSFINNLNSNLSETSQDYESKMLLKDNIIRELQLEIEQLKNQKNLSKNYKIEKESNPIVRIEKVLELDISLNSLNEYLNNSPAVERLIQIIQVAGFRYEGEYGDTEELLQYFKVVGLQEIKKLDEMLVSSMERIHRYFTNLLVINGANWETTRSFSIILAIIFNFPEKFRAKMLEDNFGWNASIADKVIDSAQNGIER